MTRLTLEQQIDHGYRIGGKTHTFDQQHDPSKLINFFFQESSEGLVLFVIFYTQACRWNCCLGCSLPSTASKTHVDFRRIMQQVDHLFENPRIRQNADRIQKLLVSNQGSVLDEDTFSTTALMYLIAKCNMHLRNLKILSLESRPQYVDEAELIILRRALLEGDTPTILEIAVGFEIFDDHIRNHVFLKGLSLGNFETMVDKLARHGFHVKCYFMFKPVPHMTDQEAIKDICLAIDYLSRLAHQHPNIVISMHLNPTYAAKGTQLEAAFRLGTFVPPKLTDVITAVMHGDRQGVPIFVGLDDEGLATPGGSFIREDDTERVDRLNRFNSTQDYAMLLAGS